MYPVHESQNLLTGLYLKTLTPLACIEAYSTCIHILVGTFAVVSLMVGSTVDKLCPSDEELSAPPPMEAFVDLLNNGSTNGSSGGSSQMACKIGVATATTFVAGLIQVNSGRLRS